MNCRACQRLLSSRQDGDLPERTSARVDEHVAVCPLCAQVAAELRRVTSDLGGLSAYQPGPSQWGRIDAALAREAQSRRARRPLLPLLAPVLGGLALVCTASGAWMLQADARRRQAAVDASLVSASASLLRAVEARWEAAEREAADRLARDGEVAPARRGITTLSAEELDVELRGRSDRFFEVAERLATNAGPADVDAVRDPFAPSTPRGATE